jgi:hypothetical protein
MNLDSQDYAPYLRDGLLCLPSKTVELLVKAGLSPEAAQAAQRGMAWTDVRRNLTDIRSAMTHVLSRLTHNPQLL